MMNVSIVLRSSDSSPFTVDACLFGTLVYILSQEQMMTGTNGTDQDSIMHNLYLSNTRATSWLPKIEFEQINLRNANNPSLTNVLRGKALECQSALWAMRVESPLNRTVGDGTITRS